MHFGRPLLARQPFGKIEFVGERVVPAAAHHGHTERVGDAGKLRGHAAAPQALLLEPGSPSSWWG